MTRICSYGGAKLRPSGTGNRPALLDLIIYVKSAVVRYLTIRLQVCSHLAQVTTSGVSPTALCGGAA